MFVNSSWWWSGWSNCWQVLVCTFDSLFKKIGCSPWTVTPSWQMLHLGKRGRNDVPFIVWGNASRLFRKKWDMRKFVNSSQQRCKGKGLRQHQREILLFTPTHTACWFDPFCLPGQECPLSQFWSLVTSRSQCQSDWISITFTRK